MDHAASVIWQNFDPDGWKCVQAGATSWTNECGGEIFYDCNFGSICNFKLGFIFLGAALKSKNSQGGTAYPLKKNEILSR